MMRHLTLTVLFVAAALTVAADAAEPRANPDRFRVIGYLPDYRMNAIDESALGRVTDVVLFSATPRADGTIDVERFSDDALRRLTASRKRHGFRLWLCVGGWERGDAFATIATDAKKTKRLAARLISFCAKHGFAGVDVDWEFPRTDAERAALVVMLRTLKSSLAAKRLQLSIAVSSWHAPPAGAYEHVDLVNVMSYDHDGRHATLDALVVDVNRLKNAGVPTHKIVAGLPFYARGIDDRNKTATYAEIVKAHHPPADVDRVGDLYFNGPDTIRAKTRWAIDKKLAGVMIWELGQDAPGDASLLRVIESTVTTDSPRPSPPREHRPTTHN